ncbi:hypothetical protein C7T94_19135 [Pedobacter yulinensis]|uniref:WD40 repeat domain-containing protein n=1 Tax=Pedobacter yulinensis TaxID=2126353 RepID=A0A2T3HGL3_9SPHI|nr:DUF6528 family protein [Pedobacter yulinensis]PST81584.1 hypothetical protein C7T94_19135 [Pedobacter yulinensis]
MFKNCLYLILLVSACTPALKASAQAKFFYAVEQGQSRVIRAEAGKTKVDWEWRVDQYVPDSARKWFSNLSEVKPVYQQQYLLITASGGGVALVRLADKKVVFMVYAGGNTHSAELLPDGNIVAASSTGGYLTLIRTDTAVAAAAVRTSRIKMPDAHNVVWDRKRQLLWATGGQVLYGLSYNMNCDAPELTIKEQIELPDGGSHDLFPVFGQDRLWLSTHDHTWLVDMVGKKLTEVSKLDRIKSLSSGPERYPLMMLRAIDTNRKWYNNQLIDAKSNVIFDLEGLKIYKARWDLPNAFSYPDTHTFKTCK